MYNVTIKFCVFSSDEGSLRRRRATADIEYGLPGGLLVRPPRGLRTSESLRSEASYQDLLHENMSLLEQLKTQEVVCRALQTQMGDIDNKMDSVTDQHIKTLGMSWLCKTTQFSSASKKCVT